MCFPRWERYMMKLASTGFFGVLSGHSGCHIRCLAGAVGSFCVGGRDAPRRTQAFQPHAVACKFSMPTLIKKPSTRIPNTMCLIFNHVNMRWAKVHALSTRGETSPQGFVSHFENRSVSFGCSTAAPFQHCPRRYPRPHL